MGFSPPIKEDVLVKAGRHCCICHKFCGTKIEVHHIKLKANGGEDTFENAIALCFDCHADMSSYDHKHPKGTKYQESELIRHRDNWYNKVNGNIGIAGKDEVVATDGSVYRVLIKILPWDGSIKFLRENHFNGFSFDRKELDNIDDLLYKRSNPAFEFIDPDLEGLRVELINNCIQLSNIIALETFPTHNIGRNAVPEEWEYQQPERFEKAVHGIHNAADSVCQTYDSLVKTATRKLGILPEDMA